MGSASLDTIRIARQEAKRYGKAYCIDLMELDEERVKALTIFDDAIFCIHVAKDCGVGISTQLQKVRSLLPENVCCAAAGSITLSDVASLKEAGISFMIVGSAIIHADDRKAAALRFKEVGRS